MGSGNFLHAQYQLGLVLADVVTETVLLLPGLWGMYSLTAQGEIAPHSALHRVLRTVFEATVGIGSRFAETPDTTLPWTGSVPIAKP